jgi:hypothetical protein
MVDHQEDHRSDDGHDERPGTPITELVDPGLLAYVCRAADTVSR